MKKSKDQNEDTFRLNEIRFELGSDINPRLEQMKSVRSTFNLSKHTLEMLDYFSKQRKITLKEIFNEITKHRSELNELADLIKNQELNSGKKFKTSGGVRKTMVVSKNALHIFKSIAAEKGISRDNLVNLAIMLLEKSTKKYQKLHKEAFELIDKFTDAAYSLESQLGKMLGQEDPIAYRMGYVVIIMGQLRNDVIGEQEDGIPVDPENWMG